MEMETVCIVIALVAVMEQEIVLMTHSLLARLPFYVALTVSDAETTHMMPAMSVKKAMSFLLSLLLPVSNAMARAHTKSSSTPQIHAHAQMGTSGRSRARIA